jgi:hypothetical protein
MFIQQITFPPKISKHPALFFRHQSIDSTDCIYRKAFILLRSRSSGLKTVT